MDEHELIRKMLPLAAADALDIEELRRVQQHSQGCSDCLRELESWSRYAQALGQLPQPSLPSGLLERTQIRIMQQQRAPTREFANAMTLIAIAIIGWASGFVMWAFVRSLMDGAVNIHGLNLVSPLPWSLFSAALSWITAAASSMVLVRLHGMRSSL